MLYSVLRATFSNRKTKDVINLTITFARHSYTIPRYVSVYRYTGSIYWIKIDNESSNLLTYFSKVGVTFFDCISARIFSSIRRK